MVSATPRGFRDVLPEEGTWREQAVRRVQQCFSTWGYDPVETPTLEALDSLAAGGIATTPFRFFDDDGNQLALRPDVTLPIARMVATRMQHVPSPLRLRYTTPVFREEESLRGQAREFTQLGVESIGMAGPAADAEVVEMLVEGLYATGLQEFVVCIATVGVLLELVDAACDDGAWRQAALDAYHTSNWVALKQLAMAPQVPPAFGRALSALPFISGGPEAVEECREMVTPLGCQDGLDQLDATMGILGATGLLRFVRVDFSIMNSLDYYTGLVMQAYAPGAARPLGSGGRYDTTLASFGRPEPAAGFAFGLETVLGALISQGEVPEETYVQADCVVGGDEPSQVFKAAMQLRARGLRTQIIDDPDADLAACARARGVRGAWRADVSGMPQPVAMPLQREEPVVSAATRPRGGEVR